jgi:hypothetical protein
MTLISDKFEKQILRIHELVEESGAEITWNDRISDPDNADRLRQVDISIKRNGKLTLIECRIHKQKQDVKWIEELIGRRQSLNADAIVAVSNSGYTRGAILKAKAYGVILRDLKSLSEEEVRDWGLGTKVWMTFIEYSNIELTLSVLHTADSLSIDEFVFQLKQSPHLFRILENVSRELDDALEDKQRPFTAKLILEDISYLNWQIAECWITAEAKKIVKELTVPSVLAYDCPEIESKHRDVRVENIDLGDFQIMQSANRVFVAADLGPVICPPNSIFRTIAFDFKRPVSMECFELLRPPPFTMSLKDTQLVAVIQRKGDGALKTLEKLKNEGKI